MCKPFMGVSANGCHHNISLWTGGKDEFKPLGNDPKNLPGLEDDLHLPPRRQEHLHAARAATCRSRARSGSTAIGGIVKHLRGADRHRLLDGEFLSPSVGYRLLGAGLRRLGLPEPHRAACASRRRAASNIAPVDAMVNPYLMAAGAAQGGRRRHHATRSIRASRRSATSTQAMEAGKKVRKLPMTLGEALEALEQGRGHQARDARRDASRVHATTSATNGNASWPHVTEWDLQAVSGLPAVKRATLRRCEIMCGIAGLIHRDGIGDIGAEMTSMLQSLKHRGPDSTGYALYGSPRAQRTGHALQGRRAGRHARRASTFTTRSSAAAPRSRSG